MIKRLPPAACCLDPDCDADRLRHRHRIGIGIGLGIGIGIGVTSLPRPSNATWLITFGISGLTLPGMLDEPA